MSRALRFALLPWSRGLFMQFNNRNALRASTLTFMKVGAARVSTKENPLAIAMVSTPFSAYRDGVHP